MQEKYPRTFGGIWSQSLSLWWRYKGFFLVVALIATIPEMLTLVTAGGPMQILNLFLMPLTLGMVAAFTSRVLDDGTPSASAAFSRALSRYWPLLWTGVLYYLIVILGCLCFIIPGILWAFSYGLSMVAVMVEQVAGNGALNRSKQLLKADRSLAANVMVGIPVLLCLGMFVFGWVTSMAALSVSRDLLVPVGLGMQFLGTWVGQSVSVAFVLLFYSLRQRQSGEDELSGVGFSRF